VDTFHAKMKGKIHKQSKLITDTDANCPYDVFQFDVEATIASIDPLLRQIIVSLPGVSRKPERELNQTKLATNVNKPLHTLCSIVRNKQTLFSAVPLTDGLN